MLFFCSTPNLYFLTRPLRVSLQEQVHCVDSCFVLLAEPASVLWLCQCAVVDMWILPLLH